MHTVSYIQFLFNSNSYNVTFHFPAISDMKLHIAISQCIVSSVNRLTIIIYIATITKSLNCKHLEWNNLILAIA